MSAAGRQVNCPAAGQPQRSGCCLLSDSPSFTSLVPGERGSERACTVSLYSRGELLALEQEAGSQALAPDLQSWQARRGKELGLCTTVGDGAAAPSPITEWVWAVRA